MNCFILILICIASVIGDNQTIIFPDCKSGPLASFSICDQSVPTYQRAADLISHMTIQEKANWLSNTVQPVFRLGVIYRKQHNGFPEATSFPAPINLAATFNINLVHQIANIISTEARAGSNVNITGLDFFTSNINIFRDPRWGRGQETPGEDPFLSSEYVYALVKGLQEGEDSRYLKIAATCKHYVTYDLESWNGTERISFDAQVSDLDLVETYLPPFETCIRDAHVASIMSSLNSINGVPACAHRFLLQTVARDTFHFDGYISCDCAGISHIMIRHNYTSNVPDTVAAALHTGAWPACFGLCTV